MATRHSTNRAQISAVAYYRMSSDRQEKSVAEQRDAVRKWAKQNGYLDIQCPLLDDGHRWKIQFEKKNARDKFKMWDQIERQINRGGLTEGQMQELWEGLYLDQSQVCELISHVETQAAHSFIHPMFVFAAYTGARRSEILRSEIEDFDFEAKQITLRERKRRKDRQGSTRLVPLHPKL